MPAKNRPDYIPANNVDVKNISCPVSLDDDVSMVEVQVIELNVEDINIQIYPGEDLESLKKIIENKKKNAPPPTGIDYFAAKMTDMLGYKVNGAAITEINADGAFGGLFLEIPQAKREYFFPAEVPHIIGVALINDAEIIVKRQIYELCLEDLQAREKGKKPLQGGDFGMYA